MKTKNTSSLKKLTGIGVFSALAFITTFVCKLIPQVAGFLTLDAKDAVIAISSFIYGPVAAPVIAFIVAFIEFISISQTGPWGLLMNFISSTAFSLAASLIYKFVKSLNGAVIGLGVATIVTTVVMAFLNIFVTPVYLGVPVEAVIELLPGVLIPFNFAKTLLNAAIALVLYKPIISAMRSAHLVPRSEHKLTFNRATLITLIIGGVSLVLAIVILSIIW